MACSAVVPIVGVVYLVDADVADCSAAHSAGSGIDPVADSAEIEAADFVEVAVDLAVDLAGVGVSDLFESARPFEDSVAVSD